MPIITYKKWMDDTARNIFTPRSAQLKVIDNALEKYDLAKTQTNKEALKNALNAWIKFKGAGWRTSTRNKNGTVQDLYNELNPTAPPKVPKPGDIDLAPSFEFANSLAKRAVPEAFERAKQLIAVAYQHMSIARRTVGEDRDIYVKWFGAYDLARFNIAFENIRAIYDALHLKPVLLYYRGNGVSGPNDCAAEHGNLVPKNFFGAAWKSGQTPASLDARYTHVFVGKAFFTSGVHDVDSTPGVIIHELSHAICGTDDVVYKGDTTYGEALCKRLALEKPDLAVTNADCYEYVCENYQNKLFVPKANVLNLPTKASIQLTF